MVHRRRLRSGLIALFLTLIPGSGMFAPGETAGGPAAPGPLPDPTRPDVTITLRPVKERHCRGERIAVDCEIVNHSTNLDYDHFRSYAPDFDPSGPEQRLHLVVTCNGKKVPLTRYGSAISGVSGSYKGMGKGGKESRRLTVNAIYDMTTIGEYHITAAMPVIGLAAKGHESSSFLTTSAEIVVRVDSDCP